MEDLTIFVDSSNQDGEMKNIFLAKLKKNRMKKWEKVEEKKNNLWERREELKQHIEDHEIEKLEQEIEKILEEEREEARVNKMWNLIKRLKLTLCIKGLVASDKSKKEIMSFKLNS